MFESAKLIVERYPALRKPAHRALTCALKTKNAILFPLVKHAGYLPRSLSDRGQDRWVIDLFGGKQGGFFLELGAADGFSESNTYILEKRYRWNGICIEPNPVLFDRMVDRYQRRCICVAELIDDREGDVDYLISGQESGLVAADTDNNEMQRASLIAAARGQGLIKRLKTTTLAGVLAKYGAPNVIDYFSFDVEGAETRILRNFPFDRYVFLALTIERPTPELNARLFSHGYHFVRNSLYDTFYVHESIPGFAKIERLPFEQIPPKGH